MQQWYYLAALLTSIIGLAVIDFRHKLALGNNPRRAGITIFSAVVVFIAWDLLGIRLGIFFHGNSQFALPYRIMPEFPIEELFFLILLCYSALLLYIGTKKLWPRI